VDCGRGGGGIDNEANSKKGVHSLREKGSDAKSVRGRRCAMIPQQRTSKSMAAGDA